jgi:thiamine-phosphate pyrophosphorylase
MRNLQNTLKLCLVTNNNNMTSWQYRIFIRDAVKGGITMVQLRNKIVKPDEFKQLAIELHKILKPLNVPLIINDYVELAAEIGVDGVHIGQQDMNPNDARKILGQNKIIGLSIESLEELEISNKLTSIDYITASAVFPSKTKPNCKKIWGLEGLCEIVEKSRHPVTAIGGIKKHNIGSIMKSGVSGVAVVGAIHDEPNAFIAAKRLIHLIDTPGSDRFCIRM